MKKYLIQQLVLDPLENEIHSAIAYRAVGFVNTIEEAQYMCDNSNIFTKDDCWAIKGELKEYIFLDLEWISPFKPEGKFCKDMKVSMPENSNELIKLTSELKAHKILMESAFSLNLNASNFFFPSCLYSFPILEEDHEWILPLIQHWGEDGLNAAKAYIENQEPLPTYQTENFKRAIEYLCELSPNVYSDIDYSDHYSSYGGYRKVCKPEDL